MNVKIMLSTTATSLRNAIAGFLHSITVEAEYGDEMVEGTLWSLGHHGPRAGNQCPCLEENQNLPQLEVIGVSHFDLDTFGGCLAVLGRKPNHYHFWKAASEVDVKGVHKINNGITVHRDTLSQLNAWWAWSEKNRLSYPRDGSVVDITEHFIKAEEALTGIMEMNTTLLAAGMEWSDSKESLDRDSFVNEDRGVILRNYDSFVNHLYRKSQAVVALNTRTGSITTSLADPIEGISCMKLMQELFPDCQIRVIGGERGGQGEELPRPEIYNSPEAAREANPGLEFELVMLAGGHAGIAGTPRNKKYSLDDAMKVASCLRRRLTECSC